MPKRLPPPPPALTASQLASRRQALNLTKSELALLLEVPAALVVEWESGEKFPTRAHTERLWALFSGKQGSSP